VQQDIFYCFVDDENQRLKREKRSSHIKKEEKNVAIPELPFFLGYVVSHYYSFFSFIK
jgi:hypothetical protein